MEKVIVPSVTLIVGCGVSSLTLLMLIIIYVSVWRYVGRAAWVMSHPVARASRDTQHQVGQCLLLTSH